MVLTKVIATKSGGKVVELSEAEEIAERARWAKNDASAVSESAALDAEEAMLESALAKLLSSISKEEQDVLKKKLG